MPEEAYPTGQDLSDYIEGCGLDVPDKLDVTRIIESEIEDWEARTGWFPFLNVKGNETLVLDNSAQGWGCGSNSGFGSWGGFGNWRTTEPIMDFYCGVVSIASINIGWPGQPPVQILQEGRDYTLLDRNAQRNGWPFTALRLHTSWASIGILPMDVIVTGKFGFCHKLPTNVWRAILLKGFVSCFPQLETNITGGLRLFQQAGVMETYEGIQKQRDDAEDFYERTFIFYKRTTI